MAGFIPDRGFTRRGGIYPARFWIYNDKTHPNPSVSGSEYWYCPPDKGERGGSDNPLTRGIQGALNCLPSLSSPSSVSACQSRMVYLHHYRGERYDCRSSIPAKGGVLDNTFINYPFGWTLSTTSTTLNLWFDRLTTPSKFEESKDGMVALKFYLFDLLGKYSRHSPLNFRNKI